MGQMTFSLNKFGQFELDETKLLANSSTATSVVFMIAIPN